jgi:hypothetical protein
MDVWTATVRLSIIQGRTTMRVRTSWPGALVTGALLAWQVYRCAKTPPTLFRRTGPYAGAALVGCAGLGLLALAVANARAGQRAQDRLSDRLEQELEDSFPASDPPAMTRPGAAV